jgi:CTP:molybdopterin cytidylyltransferase MocA
VRKIAGLRQPGKIVRPVYKGREGSPCLFSAAFRPELLSLKSGEDGRTVIQRHPSAVLYAEAEAAECLADIDTRAQAAAALCPTPCLETAAIHGGTAPTHLTKFAYFC